MAEIAVGVALAIPALVEQSIRLGKDLVDKFQSFRNYGSEVDELILVVESHWFMLEREMKFLVSVEKCLESHLKDHFKRLSNYLCNKFESLQTKVDNYSRREKFFSKLKFVFFKKILNEAILLFESRHDNLKDLLCTLTLNPSEVVDQEFRVQPADSTQSISMVKNLREAISMKTKRVKSNQVVLNIDDSYWRNREVIKHTTAMTQQTPGRRQIIIDPIPCSLSEKTQRIQDVRQLALILKSIIPGSFGILACAGIFELPPTQETCTIEMIFDIPPGMSAPRSLRSLLLTRHQNGPPYPIDARIDLAKQLARTVLYVHAADFVHKNFRPETILVFNSCNKTNSSTIGFPFLIGFQKSRPVAGGFTSYMGDTAWEQNIYRHPERQGQFHQMAYQMEHDVYSLGVCLLEIALWKPLVEWDENGKPMMSELSQFLLQPSADGIEVKADEIKARLVKIAGDMIPQILGSRYTDVTISCLTCLDYRDEMDVDAMVDDDMGVSGRLLDPLREPDSTVTVGASYIEKILEQLDEISV